VPFFKSDITRRTEIFLLIFSLLYIALGSTHGFNIYDEGVAVTGAMRVLHGEIPYRDFWTMYAPGQYYFLAGIFKIFGQSLIVERILSVVTLWGIAVLGWRIAKLLFFKNPAAICLLFLTIWIGSYNFYGSPLASGLFLATLSAYFTLLFFKNNLQRDLFLAGIFCGLTVIFRHDLGAYTILAIGFSVLVRHFKNFKSDVFKALFKEILLLGSAVAIVILPVAAFFFSQTPLKTLTDQLIKFPATTFAEYRALPFPSPLSLFKSNSLKQTVKTMLEICAFYFPIVVFASMLTIFLKRIFRRNPDENFPPFSGAALLTLLGMLFMMQVSIRADVSHLLPTMIPAIILSLFLYENSAFLPHFKNVIFIILGIFALGTLALAIYSKGMAIKDMVLKPKYSLKTGRAALISGDEFFKNYDALLQFLKDNTSENEKIFVGNGRHDKLIGNDAMLYFLSNRLPATRFHELHPGVITTELVQREIVPELLVNVKTIVLRNEVMEIPEPNKSSVSSGVVLLDSFFKKHLVKTAQFGDYTVYKTAVNE
jgi:hypothetical protein